jgi:hypothetical protein
VIGWCQLHRRLLTKFCRRSTATVSRRHLHSIDRSIDRNADDPTARTRISAPVTIHPAAPPVIPRSTSSGGARPSPGPCPLSRFVINHRRRRAASNSTTNRPKPHHAPCHPLALGRPRLDRHAAWLVCAWIGSIRGLLVTARKAT